MAKLMLLDFETSGLNVKVDRITQYCFEAYDTETKESQQASGYFWDESYPAITEEITSLTGITEALLREKGERPREVLNRFAQTLMQMDFVVAHNPDSLDKPILLEECRRQEVSLPKLPWVCTRTDLPYPERLKCRVLMHLALERGFAVDKSKAHGASYDVEMMKHVLLSFPLEGILEKCRSPKVVAKATVSYDNRERAKSRGYSWEKIGDLYFPKTWIKVLRDSQWAQEELTMTTAGVPITKVEIENA